MPNGNLVRDVGCGCRAVPAHCTLEIASDLIEIHSRRWHVVTRKMRHYKRSLNLRSTFQARQRKLNIGRDVTAVGIENGVQSTK